MNNDLLWEDIQEEFKVPVACTNGSQALKYIYFRSVESVMCTIVLLGELLAVVCCQTSQGKERLWEGIVKELT